MKPPTSKQRTFHGASKDCGDESCAKNGYRCYCGLTTKEDPFIRSNPLEAANGRLICDQWTYCSEQKNAEEDPESALFNTDESFCFRSFKSNRRLLEEVVGVDTLLDSRGASVTSVTGVTSVTSDTAKASGGTDSLDDVYGGIKRRSTLMEIQEMQDIQETVMQEAKETKENTKENEIQSKQSSSSSSSSSSHSMSRTSRRTNALVDSITNPNGQWVQTDDKKHRFVYNQDLFVDQVNTWKAEDEQKAAAETAMIFAALNATTEAVVDTSTKSISQGGNMTLDTVAIALDPKLKQIRELNQKINNIKLWMRHYYMLMHHSSHLI